ncbi:hypothetical protein N431DRAFT_563543 [Stipitochalara longipes BDJ]|nr:hypothetical protein N431DRAFT_563543 [Stipitochalara longipes BDJ]
MATSKVPTKTCCELGRECQDMFKAFMAQPGGTKISVAEQQARFNIWAANIGVFAEADASLDRRLQEDDDVRAMVVQLLQLICRNLGRVNGVHDRLNEESDQVASMGKRSNSLSSRSLRLFGRSKRKEPTIPEPSQEVVEEKVTVVVKETIDRLQRLSSAIRQVSIQNRYLKGASLIERNDHRKNESFDFRKFAICMVKREYGGATDALREQLGISLSIRRNAFLWIIRHKEKIAQERKETSRSPIQVPVIDQKAPLESQDQLGSLQGRSRSTPSIARAKSVMSAVLSRTTVPVLPKGGLKPDYLQKISSPSQPSIGGASRSFLMVNDDQLPYPRVPIIVKGFNECSCPYCFETLQKDTVHDISKWRRHVIKDLEPYVCVFAECKGSLEFFEKFDDWLSHCKRLHCSEWLCDARVHEPQIFKTKDGFQNHMRSAHGGTFNESQLPLITELGVREGPRPFTECPLCNCVPEDIEEKRKKIGDNALDLLPEHIAFHLKALAFISLPWQDVGSEEETYLHKHADSFSHDVSLGKGEDGRTASTVKDPYMLEVNVRPPEQFPERPTDEEIKNPEADTRLSWWVFQEYSRANKTDLFVKKNPYLQQEDPIIQSIARSQSRQSSENSALGSIQDIRQRKETDKFQRFLEWLSPGHSSNNSVSLEESWSKHAPGTGEWLIRNEKFQSWKQKPNSLLSLYGKGDY